MSGARPSLVEIFLSFLRLGAVSFGGPAMVAHIKKLAVAQKKWVAEEDFQRGVALCQAVPGATAMQSAAYTGLCARGLAGAVAAYVGFGLPAFLLMLALSAAYERAHDLGAVTSALLGLRVLVVALIASSAWSFGRKSVRRARDGAIALLAAAAFFFGGNPFLIVLGAGLAGALALRPGKPSEPPCSAKGRGWRALRSAARGEHEGCGAQGPPSAALVLAAGLVLVGALLLVDGSLARLCLTMMKIDAFAFGGGFASVPLMLHEVVDARGWLTAPVFMDGIALGQVTPGPIVITATFAGYLTMGLPGALVATAGIFLPSLFMVVLVEPFFRRLSSSAAFQGVTRGLVLSFVGLLASATAHFALAAPWSIPYAVIAIAAFAALLLEVEVLWVVLGAGAVGTLLFFIT
jgi:chromate transporter